MDCIAPQSADTAVPRPNGPVGNILQVLMLNAGEQQRSSIKPQLCRFISSHFIYHLADRIPTDG
jgi:hypothetical protein